MIVHGVGEIPATLMVPNIALPSQASDVSTMVAASSQATALGCPTCLGTGPTLPRLFGLSLVQLVGVGVVGYIIYKMFKKK